MEKEKKEIGGGMIVRDPPSLLYDTAKGEKKKREAKKTDGADSITSYRNTKGKLWKGRRRKRKGRKKEREGGKGRSRVFYNIY